MDAIAAAAKKVLEERRATLAKRADRAQDVREIDAALARIAEGTYGRCEACGGAIGRARLRAIPEARLCLGCSA